MRVLSPDPRGISSSWKCQRVDGEHRTERWLAGLAAVFPIGTYWLRRFANVSIAEPVAS